ncbi:hypothetical protein Mag101_11870 [Microbulbifer agarilyticus]|uniref:Lipoprotein n=1 Tax=Microbulbifer agarilyticus TaxID=260552 RepID=A0A1Q2M6K8_9GAMM|nr:hypothetical protein [Microbulbifer agarilyticus]AQQ68260.1 hypothetical protein Mag101_11870 [Microbulbifer agarilyticus]
MNRIFVIVSIAFLAACKANYVEISDDPAVSFYVGKKYVTTHDMEITGINLPPGYGADVDIYRLGRLYSVQHESPEIISRKIFPKGGIFTVDKVYECQNCLGSVKPRYLTVQIFGFDKSVDVPIKISIHEIESGEHVALVR